MGMGDGMAIEVQECRVMLGVFGDLDDEPYVLMGTCEGAQHVPGLIEALMVEARRLFGERPMTDYFWSGSSAWRKVAFR